ncbi:hypothetical protein BDY24DRAFT_416588 [Mrakia frigida]|uniref:uncharacterized protein n=1 Tax=Mrakia frigida TaxID=29902 RepID=UPI003FCC10A0
MSPTPQDLVDAFKKSGEFDKLRENIALRRLLQQLARRRTRSTSSVGKSLSLPSRLPPPSKSSLLRGRQDPTLFRPVKHSLVYLRAGQ